MRPSYYAIIPADVRYSDLKPNAKLLYGEITALSSKEGYCFATNRYFADLYSVTKNTVSLWISQLQKKGFVSVLLIKKGEQITERRIAIIKNDDRSSIKNDDLNSIKIINTTNNSNKERHTWIEFKKIKFGQEISNESQGILSVDEANEFLNYWSEANKSKTKMRWELERTWDLRARMQRWNNNTKRWKKKPGSNLKAKLDTYSKAKQMINQINKQ
jgi:DNA-binding transcriptional regulator YhcF (GntR family)